MSNGAGKIKSRSNRELKLTAALYTSRPRVLQFVKKNGTLPDEIPTGGAEIGLRLLIEKRGMDITLSSDEQVVFNAILREGRLPGGSAILIEDEEKRQKGE